MESADKSLSFITHMRSQILFSNEMTADNVLLDGFRQFHDQVFAAIDKLGTWADSPVPIDRVSYGMPPAYVALMGWIAARQKDPRSVYSCMRRRRALRTRRGAPQTLAASIAECS